MKLETDLKDNAELREQVLKNVESNRIWISAFKLINPTDETCLAIGKLVVGMLKERENLLPHYYGSEFDGEITEVQKLTPVLYLSINAS